MHFRVLQDVFRPISSKEVENLPENLGLELIMRDHLLAIIVLCRFSYLLETRSDFSIGVTLTMSNATSFEFKDLIASARIIRIIHIWDFAPFGYLWISLDISRYRWILLDMKGYLLDIVEHNRMSFQAGIFFFSISLAVSSIK